MCRWCRVGYFNAEKFETRQVSSYDFPSRNEEIIDLQPKFEWEVEEGIGLGPRTLRWYVWLADRVSDPARHFDDVLELAF